MLPQNGVMFRRSNMSGKTYLGRKGSMTYAAFASATDPRELIELQETQFPILGRFTRAIFEGR